MFRSLLCLIIVAALAGACARPEAIEATETYQVRGKFLRLSFGGAAMRVSHEEIPGFMEAMTMDIKLQNPAEAASLKPGDIVEFSLVVAVDGSHAENIRVLPAETELQLGTSQAQH